VLVLAVWSSAACQVCWWAGSPAWRRAPALDRRRSHRCAIFLAVIIVPALFLSGLMEVFKSSTWTLTYRELAALEITQAEMPA
jgi:hypothetical protein